MKRTGPNNTLHVVWAISKFLYILFVFFITTDHLTGILKLRVYIREATTKRIYLREATMKRTGPNDAFRVVWAISKCFFLYIAFFISINNLTGIYDILKIRIYIREATVKRTGPNDAKRVVWAISKFFKILFVFFMTTNHLTGILKSTDAPTRDYDQENGPKQRETRRLGH